MSEEDRLDIKIESCWSPDWSKYSPNSLHYFRLIIYAPPTVPNQPIAAPCRFPLNSLAKSGRLLVHAMVLPIVNNAIPTNITFTEFLWNQLNTVLERISCTQVKLRIPKPLLSFLKQLISYTCKFTLIDYLTSNFRLIILCRNTDIVTRNPVNEQWIYFPHLFQQKLDYSWQYSIASILR